MKKLAFILVAVAYILTGLTSCEKVEYQPLPEVIHDTIYVESDTVNNEVIPEPKEDFFTEKIFKYYPEESEIFGDFTVCFQYYDQYPDSVYVMLEEGYFFEIRWEKWDNNIYYWLDDKNNIRNNKECLNNSYFEYPDRVIYRIVYNNLKQVHFYIPYFKDKVKDIEYQFLLNPDSEYYIQKWDEIGSTECFIPDSILQDYFFNI